MKDPKHHMTKFIQKITKDMPESTQKDKTLEKYCQKTKSKKQKRKQIKSKIRKTRLKHTPSDLSPEEKNKEMKKRIPKIRERSHKTVL